MAQFLCFNRIFGASNYFINVQFLVVHLPKLTRFFWNFGLSVNACQR